MSWHRCFLRGTSYCPLRARIQLGQAPVWSVEFKPSLSGIPHSRHHSAHALQRQGWVLQDKVGGEQPTSPLLEACKWLQWSICRWDALLGEPQPGSLPTSRASCRAPHLPQSEKSWPWAKKPLSPGRAAWPSTAPSKQRSHGPYVWWQGPGARLRNGWLSRDGGVWVGFLVGVFFFPSKVC